MNLNNVMQFFGEVIPGYKFIISYAVMYIFLSYYFFVKGGGGAKTRFTDWLAPVNVYSKKSFQIDIKHAITVLFHIPLFFE
jgi:hypothetical protein